MIGLNTGKLMRVHVLRVHWLTTTGNSSAAESPFGGIKQSGYGKESGKDVAVNEYLITKTGTFTLEENA